MSDTIGTPGYLNKVTKMDRSTAADGTVFDQIHQQLLNNDAYLNDETKRNSDVFRAAAHSGVLDYSAVIPNLVTTIIGRGMLGINTSDPNTVYLGDADVLITGQVIKYLRENSIGILPAPPAAGKRDDLLFLEAWKDQTTQEWQKRLRSVAGVDFALFPEGFYTFESFAGWANAPVFGQGGNAAPLTSANGDITAYRKPSLSLGSPAWALADSGIFFAGDGSDSSKGTLKTYDGYVYAIPIAKIERRNTGGYSAANPDGSINYKQYIVNTGSTFPIVMGHTYDVLTFADATGLVVGDRLYRSDVGKGYAVEVTAINGNQVTVKGLTSPSGWSIPSTYVLVKDTRRNDGLFADIIDERDITDLRHRTTLTGYNPQQLLEEGVDKLFKGELQTKARKKMLKTYHGVRKTPLDANHLFYASFDSTQVAEVGGAPTDVWGSGSTFVPMPTGAGTLTPARARKYPLNMAGATAMTLDFFVKKDPAVNSGNMQLMSFLDGSDALIFSLQIPANTSSIAVVNAANSGWSAVTPVNHYRLAFSAANLYLYADGKLVLTVARGATFGFDIATIRSIQIGERYLGLNYRVSDVSVSNVDRGATFATLPADFISGHARITPAFTGQRITHSDALTAQFTTAKAKVQNQTQERGVTVTKGAGVNTAAWEAGDKVKVRGLAGEVIMGVVDTDTALAQLAAVTSLNGSSATFYPTDVSKFAVSDTFLVDSPGQSIVFTVTAVDTTAKSVTASCAGGTWTYGVGSRMYETTASTSSPAVKANIAGTITTVPGTWATLGTNEAEFTLGTLPGGLDVEDLFVDYSLVMPKGQGGVPEVYTATLAGEVNGHKLVPGTIAVSDDFKDKISASTAVNPHSYGRGYGATLLAPTDVGYVEVSQAHYDALDGIDGTLSTATITTNGTISIEKFAIDVISLITRKYGDDIWKDCLTLADKIAKVKTGTFVDTVTFNVWCNGSGPAGNKVTLAHWNHAAALVSASSYNTVDATLHQSAGITKLSLQLWPVGVKGATTAWRSTLNNALDENGFITYIAYAEASNGVTASVVNSDYATVEVTLIGKTGYDMLVPENPRRDAGVAGVLFVRKETKELSSLVTGLDEDNGVVTYGDYVPYQGIGLSGQGKIVAELGKFIVTTLGTAGVTGAVSAGYRNMVNQLPIQSKAMDYSMRGDALDFGDNLSFYGPQTVVMVDPVTTYAKQYSSTNLLFSMLGKLIRAATGTKHERGFDTAGLVDYDGYLGSNLKTATPHLCIYAVLTVVDNRLVMFIATHYRTDTKVDLLSENGYNVTVDSFEISGRPLIKGA